MKHNLIKILLATAAVVSSGLMSGQNLKIAREGVTTHADGRMEYVVPETVIAVDITVKRESVRKGPYARFAQKYFGAIAPLADKDIYEITGVTISSDDSTAGIAPGVPAPPLPNTRQLAPHKASGNDFAKIQPDKLSENVKSLEDAAREAASTIFSLRKRRMELVTGDYAETVFGAGLDTAIKNIDRIESEYLELFYGKQSVTTYTERYYIIPDGKSAAYIVCRFSTDSGLLPDTDLSGQPIVMELRPQGVAAEKYPPVNSPDAAKPRKENKKQAAVYFVADNVACLVTEGRRELAKKMLPVFQYGIKTQNP